MVSPALWLLLLGQLAPAPGPPGRAEFERGRALYLAGEMQEALPYLQKAMDASGRRPSTVLALGKCRQALGDAEGALLLFREYLQTVPPPADAPGVELEAQALEQQLKQPPPSEGEPDFVFQGRRPAPAGAPLWDPTPPPPAPEPKLVESPWFWVGLVAVVASGVAVAVAVAPGPEPLSGTLGTLER